MSLDIEQRFICALLTAPRNQQEAFYERQFPQRLFRIREPEASWIYAYRDQRGVYPSRAIFEARFKWEIKKVSESWEDLIESVTGQEQYRQIKQVVDQSRELIDKGVPMSKVIYFFKNASERMAVFDVASDDIDFATSAGARLRYEKIKQMKTAGPGGNLFLTPWPTINKLIKFCRPEDLVVLVGRLGMGKTWILLFWAVWLAEQGHSVLFVSKEMSLAAIEDRAECIRFMIDFEKFRDGTLPKQEELRWRRMRMKKWKANFKISGKETIEGTGVGEVVTKIRKYKPQVVVVDAIYRIVMDAEMRRKSEREQLTYLAQTSKRISKAEKVLLIVSTQMNREAEDKKGNTKGGVRTVFGTDAWGQEADIVLEVFGNRNEPDLRGLSLDKSRESGIGTAKINFRLSPFPLFDESKYGLSSSGSTVTFKGI